MKTGYNNEGYYQTLIELQEKLRKSEEERLVLEEKFNKMVQNKRNMEHLELEDLKNKYRQFLDEDRLRSERNESILRALDHIEYRAAMLTARTDRLRLLRKQYDSYLRQYYVASLVKPKEDSNVLPSPKGSGSTEGDSLFPSKFLYTNNIPVQSPTVTITDELNKTLDHPNYDHNYPSTLSKTDEKHSPDQSVIGLRTNVHEDPFVNRRQSIYKTNQVPNKYAQSPLQESSKIFTRAASTKYYDPFDSYDYNSFDFRDTYDDDIYKEIDKEIDDYNAQYNTSKKQTRKRTNQRHRTKYTPEEIPENRLKEKRSEYNPKIHTRQANLHTSDDAKEDKTITEKTLSLNQNIDSNAYSLPAEIRQRTPGSADRESIITKQHLTPEKNQLDTPTDNRTPNELPKSEEPEEFIPQNIDNGNEYLPEDIYKDELEILSKSHDGYYDETGNINSIQNETNQMEQSSDNVTQHFDREQNELYSSIPKIQDLTQTQQLSRTSSVASSHKAPSSSIYTNNYDEYIDSGGEKQNYNYVQKGVTPIKQTEEQLIIDHTNDLELNENNMTYNNSRDDEKFSKNIDAKSNDYQVYEQPLDSNTSIPYEKSQIAPHTQYKNQPDINEIQTENIQYENRVDSTSPYQENQTKQHLYEDQVDQNQYEKQSDPNYYENQIDSSQYVDQIDSSQYEDQIDPCQYEKQIDSRQYKNPIDPSQYESHIDASQYEDQIDPSQYKNQIDASEYEDKINPSQYEDQNDSSQYKKQMDPSQYTKQIDPSQYKKQMDPSQYENQIDPRQYGNQIDISQDKDQIDPSQYKKQIDPNQYGNQIDTSQYDDQIEPTQIDQRQYESQYEEQIDPSQYGNQIDPIQYENQTDPSQYENPTDPNYYTNQGEMAPYDAQNEQILYKDQIPIDSYENQIKTIPYENPPVQSEYINQPETNATLYENQTKDNLYEDQTQINPYENQTEISHYEENQYETNPYENQTAYVGGENENVMYEGQETQNVPQYEYPETAQNEQSYQYVESTNENYETQPNNEQVYYENQAGYIESPEKAYPYEESINFPYNPEENNTDVVYNTNENQQNYGIQNNEESYIPEENFQNKQMTYETQESVQRATPEKSPRTKTPLNPNPNDLINNPAKTELIDNQMPVNQISLNVTAILDSDTDSVQISEQQPNSNKDESDFEFSEIK